MTSIYCYKYVENHLRQFQDLHKTFSMFYDVLRFFFHSAKERVSYIGYNSETLTTLIPNIIWKNQNALKELHKKLFEDLETFFFHIIVSEKVLICLTEGPDKDTRPSCALTSATRDAERCCAFQVWARLLGGSESTPA